MMAQAGVQLGYRFRFLEAKAPSPADATGHLVRGAYDDPVALDAFSRGLVVATYEFENVPVDSARHLARTVPVHPAPAALEMAQDRLREKEGFRRMGIPTNAFRPAGSLDELRDAVEALGLPCVVKTRSMGYDGKGQARVHEPGDVERAWEEIGGVPLLVEAFVDFDRELSLVAVRGGDGEFRAYPLVENEHVHGILYTTIAPAPRVSAPLQAKAEEYVRHLMEDLGYVGAVAVEFFQKGDDLLANEMAPRVHNSGHWTQDGADTCQFENHLRAVLGLPLGSTTARRHTVMVNILGDTPPREAVLREPGARLHLYGKSPRPGRKIGHVNVVADSPAEAMAAVHRIEAAMPPGAGPVRG
jgi:5-(carboxyamino)imidazole ribonucleotide synthase